MWFCFNDGFVSAVEHRDEKDKLCVRARRLKDIQNIFPGKEVLVLKGSDYKYRVIVTKAEMAALVAARIRNINYDNFKDSVQDDELHTMYNEFWWHGLQYQRSEDKPKPVLKKLK